MKNYTFYYDETNNHRRVYLKENSLNIKNSDENFVLGGVVSVDNKNDFDYEKFRKDIKLQSNTKEIKLKHIAKGDFLQCLNSNKLKTFLEALYASNLYIHYSNNNIFYWSTVDIIDSLAMNYDDFNYGLIPTLKNELYKIILKDKVKFAELLYVYDYPNIKTECINEFINKVLTFIELHTSKDINHIIYLQIEMMFFDALQTDELVFIQDEKSHELIGDFFPFYNRSLILFKNSKHIFDEEPTIQEIFEENKFFLSEKNIENYHFVNSQDNELIQISDIITGFLGKYFSYLNALADEDVLQVKQRLSDMQKENLSLLKNLIHKSEKHNKYFLHSTVSLDYFVKNSIFLELEEI